MANYGTDRDFLARHLDITELVDGERRIVLTPSLQGRVMTSSADGEDGYSFGWINYDLISSGTVLPHCNNFGGEDRFWLGPEGGQFSFFFPKGSSFDFEDWQTPAVIDTEPWELSGKPETCALFSKRAVLANTSGNIFEMELERTVSLLERCETEDILGAPIPEGVRWVAFRSVNTLTNAGSMAWDRTTGMPSLWILGQFIPSDNNTVIIPVRNHPACSVNDAYFDKIGDDRLRMEDGLLRFKADGRKRGKIGIPPEMTVPVCGAVDRDNNTMTVVRFSFDDYNSEYVNSMWEHQEQPFKGDVINSYNDGPLEDGSIMGPFYELETSSPAASLRPGERLSHTHTTIHLSGDNAVLEEMAKKVFRNC